MNLLRFAKRYAVATAGALYAFTLGLRARKHRALVHAIADHFGYSDHPLLELPPVQLESVTSAGTTIILPAVEFHDGNVSLFELVAIAKLIAERRPIAVFEIGTFDGRTTATLSANTPSSAVVFTLDLPAGTPTRFALASDDIKYVAKPMSGSKLIGSLYAPKVQQLYGDSATFDFEPYKASFVFVDGSHAYDYVINDSRRALQILAGEPGTILWHDYGTWEDVTVALNHLRREALFAGLRRIEGTSLAILDVPAG